jgi:hypothetical protein
MLQYEKNWVFFLVLMYEIELLRCKCHLSFDAAVVLYEIELSCSMSMKRIGLWPAGWMFCIASLLEVLMRYSVR